MIAATPCAADAPETAISAHSLPAWWAGAGRPGWSPDAMQASGMPWTIAGLTQGAWRIDDPFATGAAGAPGIPEAQPPLAWYDSTRVVFGEGAAWDGFGAALATAEGFMKPSGSRKPRAVFTLMSSDGGVDRNGILVSRGDERSWLHAGAVAGKRSGIADLGPAGDHLWGFVSGARCGAHVLSANFTQRGMGESLKDSYFTTGESALGENGSLKWDWGRGATQTSVQVARSWDSRASFFPYGNAYSRRDAWRNSAGVTLRHETAGRGMEWRASWDESRASRSTSNVRVFEEWDHRLWSAARAHAPLLGGRAEVALGGGFDGAMARKRERWQLAPSFSWKRSAGERSVRFFGERILTPVWSDLDRSIGQKPFMQDCWVGGITAGAGAGAGASGRRSVEGNLMAGRAGSRATTLRYPVRDVALRFQGWAADPLPYSFLLAQVNGEWYWRALGGDARGYVLARDVSVRQGSVDPGLGGAVGVSSAFKAFAGDLAGRVRLEAAWVGERDSDARVELFENQRLPGYATFAASATMTVGDMTLQLHLDGLEDERHPQGWVNPAADAVELARGPARRFRFELSWPLFN